MTVLTFPPCSGVGVVDCSPVVHVSSHPWQTFQCREWLLLRKTIVDIVSVFGEWTFFEVSLPQEFVLVDSMDLNALFNNFLWIYYSAKCTYPCVPGVSLTSALHNISLAAFSHKDRQNKDQW